MRRFLIAIILTAVLSVGVMAVPIDLGGSPVASMETPLHGEGVVPGGMFVSWDAIVYSYAYKAGAALPDGYSGSPLSSGEYLYSYVAYNEPSSTVALSIFTVGNDAMAMISETGSFESTGPALSGVPQQTPTGIFTTPPPGAALQALFIGDDSLDPDEYSEVMYMIANMPPDLTDVAMVDGGTSDDGLVIGPAPIPEAGTLCFFGAIGIGLVRRLRRKR
jgi:hypothetical protein